MSTMNLNSYVHNPTEVLTLYIQWSEVWNSLHPYSHFRRVSLFAGLE